MAWFRRHPVWTVVLLVALVAVVLVGGSAITVWRAAHHDGAADTDRADAIVVLGAAQYNGVPSPLFQGRLDHAVLLWQQGRADLVITVGSKQPGDRHTEAESGAAYLEQHGVPADKIVLGLPFYGRSWGDVENRNNGLFQPGKATLGVHFSYHELPDLIATGFVRHWDSAAAAPYLYNPRTKVFVTYEDPQSIAAKCRYVTSHRLRGIMFWEYSNDTTGILLEAVHGGLTPPPGSAGD